jgi:hypothetical protein
LGTGARRNNFVFGEKAYLYMIPGIAAEYIERSKILMRGLVVTSRKVKD